MYKKIIVSLFFLLGINVNSVFAQGRLQDSLALVELYDSTDGDNWNINYNWKSGPLDTWYGVTVTNDRVTQLVLNNNYLVGTIPSSIGNIDSLTYLDLSDNPLTDSIPPEIGGLLNLTYLDLSDNQLSGSIPPQIGGLTNLQELRLSDNQLSGSIPPEIGNLANLTYWTLNNNQLTGEIPPEIGNLSNLTNWYLNNNQLTGEIPPEIGNLSNLTDWSFFDNQLTGEIPPEIGNLSNLTYWELYSNQLTGEIPPEIGNLSNLTYLNLYNNNLIDLPDLSALSSLRYLRIQTNQFTFEDIEPNIGVPSMDFTYSPQDSVGEVQDTTVNIGSSLTISVTVGGEHNEYQWKKDGSIIPGATNSAYIMDSVSSGDTGSYICEITNTVATELTLYSRPINVSVDGSGVSSELPKVYSINVKGITGDKNLKLRYTLPEKAQVRLSLYDVSGKVVKEFSGGQQAGVYSIKIDMNDTPTGVYFVRMDANGKAFSETRKVILIK